MISPKPAVTPKPIVTPKPVVTPKPEEPIKVPPPSIILPKLEGSGTKQYPDGTIVWRQGKYWKAIYPPYNQDKPDTLKEAPPGATIRTGKKSAYRTVQVLRGQFNGEVYVDMGAQDVKITGSGNDMSIEFSRNGAKTNVGASNSSPKLGMGRRNTSQFGKNNTNKQNKPRRINKNVI
jgi:hypothetical protein